MRLDATGRRRRAGQERGLRPLYPALPGEWVSRALRIAMPARYWRQFEAHVARTGEGAPTTARASGRALMALMDAPESSAGSHWLDWERDKACRLLAAARRAA
ncbi:MAG: hypothetical protein C5B48_01140 [Candidatus Rokuibacteriota bacterium]|nr:MAG: hypothetical protein C5B48_01140 [Candidatus Rokubacteria bacterium]